MELKKYFWRFALTAVLGIAGCNLFNPTQSVDIKSDDAAALTYEGYLHYQKTEYSEARYYFIRALEADSTHSEAWYGLAKSVFSTRNNLNPFDLIKYLRSSSQSDIFVTFREMDDATACAISADIDSVMIILDDFVRRDKNGLTDGRITFANFGQSYSLLSLIRAAILSKDLNLNFNEIITYDQNEGIKLDTAMLKSSPATMHAFAAFAQGLMADPTGGAALLKGSMPDSTAEWFTDKAFQDATVATAKTILYIDDHYTDRSSSTYVNERCQNFVNNGAVYNKVLGKEIECDPSLSIMDWRCER